MEPEQAMPAQLRARGIEPQRDPLVVMTHLHLDHASAISEFTNAVFVLGQGEWAAVHAPRPTFNGYMRKHVAHAVDYREVPYDTGSTDSYSTFARVLRPVRGRLGAPPPHARPHPGTPVADPAA